MNVNRKEFLQKLQCVVCGAHKSEELEQSNCFIFSDNTVMAFNGEIFAACALEFPEEFAVNAFDLLQMVSRFPDEEISLDFKKNQLVISGNKKRAGLTVQKEILLPIGDIPRPKKMAKAVAGLLPLLQMAAKICDSKSDNFRVSHVHIEPEKIEATDRFRLFRIKTETGLEQLLVPAKALCSIGDMKATHVEILQGWFFLKDAEQKIMIGICCAEGDYFKSSTLDGILNMEGASKIILPDEMNEAIDRAMIMAGEEGEREAKVTLDSSSLIIRTQKDSGWYEEKQKVKYKGEDMSMQVNLSLLKSILSKTKKALISPNKIKMEKDGMELVVSLEK